MLAKLASKKAAFHCQLVASRPETNVQSARTVSYWRLGNIISAAGSFHIFRAAPKAMLENDSFDYVIKLVNPNLEGEEAAAALDRLSEEAISTELLDHHGVIPLLDAELDKAPFFLVEPWIAGGSLDQFMAKSQNMSMIQALWIIRQVAEAIAAAHQRGRVYLGLDPSHVLMRTGGRIVLIGWSNSYSISQPIRSPKNRLQTIRYSAPECFEVGAFARKPSDIYSLGIFIYNLFAGRTPFNGPDYDSIVKSHRDEQPIELIRHQPLCPTRLGQLTRRMLDKDPYNRPEISEVMEQLISIEIENLENPALIEL